MKTKYLSIVISLWLAQVACMYMSAHLLYNYYSSDKFISVVLSALMLWLSIKAYAYRLDFKRGLVYRIKQAAENNPVNELNRRQRRSSIKRRR